MRIVHLSDIHFWQYAFNPLRLMSKRLAGMVVAARRAGPDGSGWRGSRGWSSGSGASSRTTS